MMIYDDGLGQGEGDDNIGQVGHDDDDDEDDGLGQGEGKMTERQEDSGVPAGVSSLTCPREARRHCTGRTGLICVFICIFFLVIFPPHELLYMANGIYYPAKILIMLHAL